MRGVRKNRYREATRTLQSGVPDNLRGCWSGLYPYASRSKYQKAKGCRDYGRKENGLVGGRMPPTAHYIARATPPTISSLSSSPTCQVVKRANSTSRRRLRELALGRVGRTRRSGSRNTRRRALSGGPDQTPRHRSSRALNVARILNTAE